jgi:general secretion pathway protein M
MNTIKLWWAGLGARDQRMLGVAVMVVALALLWFVAVAPALRTLRSATAQQAAADSQLQSMRAQAEQATALRAQRPLSYDEALRNLESSVKQTLGAGATLSVNDTRASLTLKNTSADALALWLGQARINARVVPSEARLQRSAAPVAPAATGGGTGTAVGVAATAAAGTASAAATTVSWDGTLVLTLPPR